MYCTVCTCLTAYGFSVEFCCFSGTYLLDHLAADGAGFPEGQVAVVTVGQVDTDFGRDCILSLSIA